MPETTVCNLCPDPDTLGPHSEKIHVRSNVRRFSKEKFPVWRCRSCGSLHSQKEVDLNHYYKDYPFHKQEFVVFLKMAYGINLRRLTRSGLKRHHTILDYGCGSGLMVRYFKERGYRHATGYDAFSDKFNDPSTLEKTYDCLFAQDLVEHVHEPLEQLKEFDRLTKPGGIIAIGTPNATGIDLQQAEEYVHNLHQPYHTHIFSKSALIRAGEDLGWSLDQFYIMQYNNTPFPFVNVRYGQFFGKCYDNMIDLAFENPKLKLSLLSPKGLFLALFGYFLCPEGDMLAIFRKPEE